MNESAHLLDIRTLSVVLILVGTFAAITLATFSRVVARYAGIDRVGAGFAFIALSFALLAVHDALAPWLGVIAANLLSTLGWVLIYEGIAAFRGVRSRVHWLGAVALTVVAVTFSYYTFFSPSVRMRIVWISVVHAVLALVLAHAALVGTSRSMIRFGQWLVAGPLAVLAAFLAARGLVALGEPEAANILADGLTQALAYLLMILVAIASSCGLLWLAFTRLEAEMRRQSRTDPLTGVLNRRAMDEVSIAEIGRATRGAGRISILIADLDHFKAVNDAHGHLVGDEVLRQFAALIAANIRSHDTLVRYGGEEFLVLLPETDKEEAAAAAEKLRALTEAHRFTVGKISLEVRVSFGVATLQHADDDWSHLLRRADAALYEAKNTGRNRVSCAWDSQGTKTAGVPPATS